MQLLQVWGTALSAAKMKKFTGLATHTILFNLLFVENQNIHSPERHIDDPASGRIITLLFLLATLGPFEGLFELT